MISGIIEYRKPLFPENSDFKDSNFFLEIKQLSYFWKNVKNSGNFKVSKKKEIKLMIKQYLDNQNELKDEFFQAEKNEFESLSHDST